MRTLGGGSRFFADEPAVGELDNAIAVGGIFFGVGDLDDGGAGIVEFFEELHDLFALDGVKIAGGLIGQDELGILDDRARDADELLLAAGELTGEEIFFADDIEAVEGVADEAGPLLVRDIFVGEGDFEIFVNGEVVDEVVGLEDEADVVFVELVALLGVEFVNGLIEEQIFAGPGAVEHAEDAEEGGLPCPGGTHEGNELAGLDLKGDAAKDIEFLRAGLEGFFDVLQLDERLHVDSFLFVAEGDDGIDARGAAGGKVGSE